MRSVLIRARGPTARLFSSNSRGFDPTLSLFLPPASLFRAGKLAEYEPSFALASPRRGPGGPALTPRAAAALALKVRPLVAPDSRPWATSRSMLATDEMRRLARRGLVRLAEHLSAKAIDKDVTLATGALTPTPHVIIANSPKPGQVVDGRVTPPRRKELVGDEARDRIVKAFGAYSPLVRAGVETALNTRLLMDERALERVYEEEYHEKAPTGPEVSRAMEKAYKMAGEVAELALRAQAMGHPVTAAPPAAPPTRRDGGSGAAPQPRSLRDIRLSPVARSMVAEVMEEGELPLPRPGSYGLPFKYKSGGAKGGAPLGGEQAALAGALATERTFLLRTARKAFLQNGVDVGPFSSRPHSKELSRTVRVLRLGMGLKDGGVPPTDGAPAKRKKGRSS